MRVDFLLDKQPHRADWRIRFAADFYRNVDSHLVTQPVGLAKRNLKVEHRIRNQVLDTIAEGTRRSASCLSNLDLLLPTRTLADKLHAQGLKDKKPPCSRKAGLNCSRGLGEHGGLGIVRVINWYGTRIRVRK